PGRSRVLQGMEFVMLAKHDVEGLFRPIAEARGLPAVAYTSEAFACEEQERLFATTWMCAGYAHELPSPGDVLPRTVAGVPLFFSHGRDGRIRCFHNVCSHRGSIVVGEAASGQQALRCRYHGWTYGLEGELRVTPHWGGHNTPTSGDIDKSCLGLKPVAMHRWHDWLFVNIDGQAGPFETYAAPFLAHFAAYGLDEAVWCRTL